MDHSDPLRTLFADDLVFHQPGTSNQPRRSCDLVRDAETAPGGGW